MKSLSRQDLSLLYPKSKIDLKLSCSKKKAGYLYILVRPVFLPFKRNIDKGQEISEEFFLVFKYSKNQQILLQISFLASKKRSNQNI